MRSPMDPPPLNQLAGRLFGSDPGSMTNLLGSYVPLHSTLPYLHWDDLRYREPPSGLSHEEWWFAAKLARTSGSRQLGHFDSANDHFFYNLPDEVLRETDFVNKNASGRLGIAEQVTNPATRDQYLVSSLIEEAVTSSQLEGASTNKQVAREMIRSGREPRDRSERMILNNYYAMERVGELRNEKLTFEVIFEIHNMVTQGTLDDPDAAGRFQREHEERVAVWDGSGGTPRILYSPPPVREIEERMQQLCDFANDTESKAYLPGVLRALAVHFMVGYIHPFEDGNGRTARVLFYWSMLNQGYWLTEFLSVSSILKKAPSKYARSFLLTESDDNDLTYFFIYHLGVMHRAIDALTDYLQRKVREAQEVRRMLADQADVLKSRQIALIRNALKNPTVSYSVQSHMRSHRIAMETARKDLAELQALGLLQASRAGKRNVYTPASDLAEVIKHIPHAAG